MFVTVCRRCQGRILLLQEIADECSVAVSHQVTAVEYVVWCELVGDPCLLVLPSASSIQMCIQVLNDHGVIPGTF